MKRKTTQKGVFRKVLRYLKHETPLLILSLVFAAVTVLLTLWLPLVIGDIIDLITAREFDKIPPLLIRSVIMILGTALSQWLMNVCNNRMTYGVVRQLRSDAFDKIQALPISYLDAHPTGETVSRVISDVDQFTDGLLMGFTQFFTGVLTIVGTIVFMLTINPAITAVVVVVTPLSLFVASFIAKKTYSLFRAQSETRAEQTAYSDEMIAGHKTVLAFGQEDESQETFDEVNNRLQKISLKALFFSSLTNPSTRFVNSLVYTGVAFAGAMMCVGGGAAAITVGELSCFLTYANQYTKPFNEISGVITELQNALACAGRLFELIDTPSESPDPALPSPAPEVRGEITLENVCFSYDKQKKLIENFNLHLHPGERAAIVGPTGCGKTTVINLLMRFYDPDSGTISVDGNNTRELPRSFVRSSFGMVLQETWLRAGTIRENICFGKPDATDEEMVAAAKAAHADSFIRRLPDGYDTVIGEDGGSLSQGQKQLLCIARVMLCLPPMLILDEATSSIDTRTEQKIQKAFASMMAGRTSFIVAHRLSTIEDADVILVMKDGNVIEQGSHRELLEKGGFYSVLYNSQFEK